jgi:hypothetical protein
MNDNPTQSNIYDRREARRQRRLERRGGSWVGGLMLIGLGILLLMQNAGTISFGRWWSLLILIPAVAAFANAWKEYQAAGGRLTGRAISALIGGLLLSGVTAALLFNLDWGWFGPALLLLAGLGFFFRGFADHKSE